MPAPITAVVGRFRARGAGTRWTLGTNLTRVKSARTGVVRHLWVVVPDELPAKGDGLPHRLGRTRAWRADVGAGGGRGGRRVGDRGGLRRGVAEGRLRGGGRGPHR